MKKTLHRATQSTAFRWAVQQFDRIGYQQPHLLRVLTYHRVDDPANRPHLSPSLLSATPQGFADQMRYVKAHYNPISTEQVLAHYRSGEPLPARAMLITVDDAYADFEEHIWPICRQYDVPVTLFVPTAYPDHPERRFWWDVTYHAIQTTTRTSLDTPFGQFDLSSASGKNAAYAALRIYVKSLPHAEAMAWVDSFCAELDVDVLPNVVLGWDALCRLAAEGVTLAPHTHTHPMLQHLSLNAVREEIVTSSQRLEEETGATLPVLAYPAGGVSDAVVGVLDDEGFELAFTTERGIHQLETDHPLRIHRINISQRVNPALIQLQCTPFVAKLLRVF